MKLFLIKAIFGSLALILLWLVIFGMYLSANDDIAQPAGYRLSYNQIMSIREVEQWTLDYINQVFWALEDYPEFREQWSEAEIKHWSMMRRKAKRNLRVIDGKFKP